MPLNPKNEKAEAVRFVTSATLATMLGTSRGTVQNWIEAGCPVVSRPSGPGTGFTLDVAEVVQWRIDRSTAEAETRAAAAAEQALRDSGMIGDDDGQETEEQADRRRAISNANMAEMKEAELAGSVIPIAAVESMIAEEYASMRLKFENLGNTLAARTAQITDPAKVKATADKLVRAALASLVGDIRRA